MSNDLNKCMFIGRLGADPEQRFMPNGSGVTNFRIAVGQSWKDKDSGEKKEATEWVSIVAFNQLSDICAQYLVKGSQVFVEGRMRTRKWQDKDGVDRYSTEIIAEKVQMLGGKREGSSDNQQQAPARTTARPATKPAADDGFFDDDIPF